MLYVMRVLELERILLCVLFAMFLTSAFFYFLLGERLLLLVRTRFPAQWRSAGTRRSSLEVEARPSRLFARFLFRQD